MPPLPTSMLAERLERLEREDRRRKRMRVPALVGLIALAAGGAKLADPPKLVEAERIVLRDKTGKMRARLAVGRDGAPNLEFFDEGGKPRIEIGIAPDLGPVVNLLDGDQKGRITLTVSRFGASQLSLHSEDGARLDLITARKPDNTAVIAMGHEEGGADRIRIVDQPLGPGITFLDEDRDVRLALGSDADGSTDVSILGKGGKERLILGAKADGAPYLKLNDKDGKTSFSAPK